MYLRVLLAGAGGRGGGWGGGCLGGWWVIQCVRNGWPRYGKDCIIHFQIPNIKSWAWHTPVHVYSIFTEKGADTERGKIHTHMSQSL